MYVYNRYVASSSIISVSLSVTMTMRDAAELVICHRVTMTISDTAELVVCYCLLP